MSDALSAHAAAARLGVSDRTVRRWIASGRLRADKAAGEFQITLEDLDTLTGHAAAAAAAPGHEPDNAAAPATEGSRLDAAPAAALSADLSGLIAMIERQQEQLLERTEAAGMWQARAMMLEERMKALEAPKPVPEFVPPAVHDPQPAPSAGWSDRWQGRVPVALVVLAVLAMIGMALPAWVQ